MEHRQLPAQPRSDAHPHSLKIVVADDLPDSAIDLLRAEPGWQIDARSGRPAAELARDLADADALLVRSATKVTADLLAAAPQLRIVGRAGTGVDNIDMNAASGRGILVVNAPGANSISVAEQAFALMLSLARSVPAADRAMKDGKWEKKRFVGTELRGKTLGIAGLGRIGQEVAVRARSFGMRIVAHDPFISQDIAAGVGAELLSLDDLFATADFVTLHLPSTPATRHLLNDERFARMKPGIRIINTARGDLIDEAALRRAIEKGIVAGAGLDVFEKEPPADWALAQLPQVVATPHIAASTEEAQELVGLDTAAAVRDFLRDGLVRNAVNFPSVHPDELQRLQPWIRLVDHLAAIVAQMGTARIEALGLRYYGALAETRAADILGIERGGRGAAADSVGRRLDRERAQRRPRARHRDRRDAQRAGAALHQPRLDQAAHERRRTLGRRAPCSNRTVRGWCRCAASPSKRRWPERCSSSRTTINRASSARSGTILGSHGVNIANFALGRGESGAIGVVNVDEDASAASSLDAAVEAIRRVPAVGAAWVVRLPATH